MGVVVLEATPDNLPFLSEWQFNPPQVCRPRVKGTRARKSRGPEDSVLVTKSTQTICRSSCMHFES